VVELCERHGVRRKTGDKWMARYEREGADGLRERRRAPELNLPAPSTTGDLLAGRGSVKKRRRRRLHTHPGVVRERPHQFLNGRRPASMYRPSPRPSTGRMPPFAYPRHYIPKRVTNAGTIRFKRRLRFIANALKQHVGRAKRASNWSAPPDRPGGCHEGGRQRIAPASDTSRHRGFPANRRSISLRQDARLA
jgi:hypothetical protein